MDEIDQERSAQRTAFIIERLKAAFLDAAVVERVTTSLNPSDRDFRVSTREPLDHVLRVTRELLGGDRQLDENRLFDAIYLMKKNPGKVVKLYSDGSPELRERI